MVSMPNIRVVKPSNMLPVSRFFPDLQNMYRIIPIRASTGANDDGFSSNMSGFELLMPVKLNIHAVTHVPILAPIITFTACLSRLP